MPSFFQFLFPLFQKFLKFLNHPQILLSAGPIVEKLFQLLILLFHHSNSIPIFLHHAAKLFLDLLCPFHLLVCDTLNLLFVCSFELLLSITIFLFYFFNLFLVGGQDILNSLIQMLNLIVSTFQITLCFIVAASLFFKIA